MDEKARLSSLCAKWFYFLSHSIYLLAIFVLPNAMRESLLETGNPWFIFYGLLQLGAFFLYVATWSSPGFLDQHPFYQEQLDTSNALQKYTDAVGQTIIREATNESAKETIAIDLQALPDDPSSQDQEDQQEQ